MKLTETGGEQLRAALRVAYNRTGSTMGTVLSDLYYYMGGWAAQCSHNLHEDGVRIVSKGQGERVVVRSFKKWLTFVKAKVQADGFSGQWSVAEIEAAATLWGTLFTPKSYTFEIVSGDELLEAYRTGPKSCMGGEGGASPTLHWYVNNGVRLVKISEEGTYMGRALLWETTDGVGVLDRVYPSDGGLHARAVRKWAHDQGWLTREGDSAGYHGFKDADGRSVDPVVALPHPEGNTPYVDSMSHVAFFKDGTSLISTTNWWRNDSSVHTFSIGWGEGNEPWMSTDTYGTRGPVWEMVSTLDGNVHPANLSRMVQREDGQWMNPQHVIHCAVTGVRAHVREMAQVRIGRITVYVANEALVPFAEQASRNVVNLVRGMEARITAGFAQGLVVRADLTHTDEQGRVWEVDEWHDYRGWRNGTATGFLTMSVDGDRAAGPWFGITYDRVDNNVLEVAPGVRYLHTRSHWYYLDSAAGTREELYDRAARHYASLHGRVSLEQAAD